MNSLSKEHKLLWMRIRTILMQEWDPIGVYEEDSESDDEYDSYVPNIFRLALEDRDATRIAKSLTQIAQVSMGLSVLRTDHDLQVAELIIAAKEEILG